MVLNLAINARDAMAGGGRLHLEIAPVELDADRAGALGLAPGAFARLTVADTGSGMDEETRRRCFEPLYTTKGPSKGTGLGLPAVRRVVAEAGGAVHFETELGKGTTFEVLLPRLALEDEVTGTEEGGAPGAGAPAEVGEPAALARGVVGSEAVGREAVARQAVTGAAVDRRVADGRGDPAVVLLAEDDDGLRELARRVLVHRGHLVLEASGGPEALALAESFAGRLHLLVSDVAMPGLAGNELAARLRASRPGLPVLLVSGTTDASVLRELESGPGPVRFLAKPFKPSQLTACVEELLEQVAALPGAGAGPEARVPG